MPETKFLLSACRIAEMKATMAFLGLAMLLLVAQGSHAAIAAPPMQPEPPGPAFRFSFPGADTVPPEAPNPPGPFARIAAPPPKALKCLTIMQVIKKTKSLSKLKEAIAEVSKARQTSSIRQNNHAAVLQKSWHNVVCIFHATSSDVPCLHLQMPAFLKIVNNPKSKATLLAPSNKVWRR